jgi:hypothetical protein
MDFSLHLPNPFKTWAAFYHLVLEQRGPDSNDDTVTLTEVRPTGGREAGYVTHYSAPRVYSIAYIQQQVAREEQEVNQRQSFTFTELQTILYALGRTSRDLDPNGNLRAKVQTMRDNREKPGE